MADQTQTVATVTVEQQQSVITNLRTGFWKFFGALFMESKDGVQAVSLHRVLALTTYVACMWLWLSHLTGTVTPEVKAALEAAKLDVPKVLHAAGSVPDTMLYTLWGLLGIGGASKVASIVKGTGNGDSQLSA